MCYITMGMEKILSSENIQKTAEWAKKLTENSKTEDIVNYLQNYRESANGKKLNERFNTFSKEDQLKLYKNGWLTMGKYLKRTLAMGMVERVQSIATYTSKTLKATGPELSVIYRFMVYLGVLDNPWIPKEELVKDVKKDAKFIKIFMTVIQGICKVAAPEAVGLISELKITTNTLSNKVVDITATQIENNKESVEKIEAHTKDELKENLSDINKKAA